MSRSAGNLLVPAGQRTTERRLESRQDELVDAQSAEHRVAADLLHQRSATGDDARLRPAEQLIAAEGDEVDTRFEALVDQGLVHPVGLQVDHAAAAEILVQRQTVLVCEGRQLLQCRSAGEAFDAKVAGMDAQDQAGSLVDRRPVVIEIRLVGRADLVQDSARSGP